jgi:hypothetical protein
MTERAIFPERILDAGGGKITVRPLSFYELMVEIPDLVGRMMDKMAGADEGPPLQVLLKACSSEILEVLSKTAGVDPEFWKRATAEEGAAALAVFAELNLTENFFVQVARLIEAGQGIGSAWSRLFSNTGTDGKTSGATALARLQGLSRPSSRKGR